MTGAGLLAPVSYTMAAQEEELVLETESQDATSVNTTPEAQATDIEESENNNIDLNENNADAETSNNDIVDDTEGETQQIETTTPEVTPPEAETKTDTVLTSQPYFSLKKILGQLATAMVIFVIPGCIIYWRAKHGK